MHTSTSAVLRRQTKAGLSGRHSLAGVTQLHSAVETNRHCASVQQSVHIYPQSRLAQGWQSFRKALPGSDSGTQEPSTLGHSSLSVCLPRGWQGQSTGGPAEPLLDGLARAAVVPHPHAVSHSSGCPQPRTVPDSVYSRCCLQIRAFDKI